MLNKGIPNSFFKNDLELVRRYFNKFQSNENTAASTEGKFTSLTNFLENISLQSSVLVLMWNIVTDRFVYAVDKRKVVGHDVALYLADDGIQFSLSNMHPDFYNANFVLQKTSLDYLINYKGHELNKIIINSDGLYKKSNGEYFHFLQQVACIETDANGSPVLFLGYIHDITHLKKWESVNHIITTPNEIKLWNYNAEKNCVEPLRPFSEQEKKILSYLAQGQSSKEIATELFISPHTVDTHRRNLLERSNCLNTTGLITYAKLVGLL